MHTFFSGSEQTSLHLFFRTLYAAGFVALSNYTINHYIVSELRFTLIPAIHVIFAW